MASTLPTGRLLQRAPGEPRHAIWSDCFLLRKKQVCLGETSRRPVTLTEFILGVSDGTKQADCWCVILVDNREASQTLTETLY